MFYVYILYSNLVDRFYIGSTNALFQRLNEHRNGFSQYTKQANDWELVYSKEFSTRAEAVQFERYLKSWKDRAKLVELAGRSVGVGS